LYYDTTENEFKGYKDSSWYSLGGEDTWITTQTCSTGYALQSVGKTTKTCINKVDYSDIAYDLSCTDCIGTTEIADSYVLNTGDAMTGVLDMGNNKITNVATPTAASDVATKGYVDTKGIPAGLVALFLTFDCPAGWSKVEYFGRYTSGYCWYYDSGCPPDYYGCGGGCTSRPSNFAWCKKN